MKDELLNDLEEFVDSDWEEVQIYGKCFVIGVGLDYNK
jgi:hypothetical protein